MNELLNQQKSKLTKFTSSGELLQTREDVQSRVYKDMLGTCQRNARMSPSFVLLVLDSYTAHLVSLWKVDLFELFKAKVYQVENIHKKRKRYPMSDVIYFVSPDSAALIAADFPEKDSFSYDQYGCVHLCFVKPCNEFQLNVLAKTRKLASKVLTVLEANADFLTFTDNVFLVNPKPEL